MPNNTWLTPYTFPPSRCLSLGPSQGIVYELYDNAVIKVPFQYPVNKTLAKDEADEQIYLSFRSLALFKRENDVYTILAEQPHRNLLQRLQSRVQYGIVLPRLIPLAQAPHLRMRGMRIVWIQHLVSSVEWLEHLGYVHGDLKVQNLGIDANNQLKIFDFGSAIHCNEEGFSQQGLDDQFDLAMCIHFLASGIDPYAKANSGEKARQITKQLRAGQGVVDEAAKDFEGVIQAGWTGAVTSFSSLRETVTAICANIEDLPEESFSEDAKLVFDDLVMKDDSRWMDKEDYRRAWEDAGYKTPDDLWN